jgi:hypothetical protein
MTVPAFIPKKLFFTDKEVIRATNAATRSNFTHLGGYCRKMAINSIKKRRGVSAPDAPPHSHVGTLRRHIYYHYNPKTKSVVIGPARISTLRKKRPGVAPVAWTNAPALLEWGGKTTRRQMNKRGTHFVTRPMRYRKRPFMVPAMEATKAKLPAVWRDSIKATNVG